MVTSNLDSPQPSLEPSFPSEYERPPLFITTPSIDSIPKVDILSPYLDAIDYESQHETSLKLNLEQSNESSLALKIEIEDKDQLSKISLDDKDDHPLFHIYTFCNPLYEDFDDPIPNPKTMSNALFESSRK